MCLEEFGHAPKVFNKLKKNNKKMVLDKKLRDRQLYHNSFSGYMAKHPIADETCHSKHHFRWKRQQDSSSGEHECL